MNQSRATTHGADVFRGFAIFAVVLHHAFGDAYGSRLPWIGWYHDFSSPPSQPFMWFYPISYGWAGVPLFFVLSGFCIHLSFLRGGKFEPGHFFWRRFWRIYPAYAIALLGLSIVTRVDIFTHEGAEQFFSHALFLHNFQEHTFFGINPSFWSIATEVQLYLLFPLLLSLRSRFQIAGCLLVTFVLGLAWRGLAVALWGLPDHVINAKLTTPLITWFDWTLGAFVAERFFEGRRAFARTGPLLLFFAALFVASTFYKPATIFSFSLAAAIGAISLDAALSVDWKRVYLGEGLAFLGLVSYSLYLWHQPLIYRVIPRIERITGSGVRPWLVFIPLMIGGSWLSYRFIEQVSIAVGNTLGKPRPRPAGTLAQAKQEA